MKIIVSKKKKKKDRFCKPYWKTLYPEDFVDVLCSEEDLEQLKIASRKKEVSLVGTLKTTKDNFVYLDIANNILNGLYSMIGEDADKPPYNLKSFNKVGAHISIIGSSEFKDKKLKTIEEVGQEFNFKTGKIYQVKPDGWKEMDAVWFMDVESTGLEQLRQKYGLAKKLDGHNFHISFAVRKKK